MRWYFLRNVLLQIAQVNAEASAGYPFVDEEEAADEEGTVDIEEAADEKEAVDEEGTVDEEEAADENEAVDEEGTIDENDSVDE